MRWRSLHSRERIAPLPQVPRLSIIIREFVRQRTSGGVAQPSSLDAVTYVDDGIVIINDRPAKVKVDNGTKVWVHGILLITLTKRATINGTMFTNRNSVISKVPVVAKFPLLNITASQNVLSLPYLHRLNERNFETIRKFKEEIGADRAIQKALITGAICCALVFVGLMCWRRAKRVARRINEMVAGIGSAEGGLNLEGE